LYGNATVADILMKAELAELERKSGGRVTIIHVVGTTPDQSPIEGWEGELGK
jgi:NAD(P)H-flavin reductase